jgi:hypothetical protein
MGQMRVAARKETNHKQGQGQDLYLSGPPHCRWNSIGMKPVIFIEHKFLLDRIARLPKDLIGKTSVSTEVAENPLLATCLSYRSRKYEPEGQDQHY